jgi:hypothetical protein
MLYVLLTYNIRFHNILILCSAEDLMQKPIPLAMYESQVDFWYQMKACMYSVRSSYRLARTNSVDGEHLKASGNGMIIWQLARQST